MDPIQQMLEVWRAYPAKAKNNQVAVTLTSFSVAFVSEATNVFQIEDAKGEEDDSVVFAKIKSGINAIIQNCTKGCPEGPQIASWGYKNLDMKALNNCNCACGNELVQSNIQRLVFYNSIVDIEYELTDKGRNPAH